MEYTRLGRTGLKVSRIALGCMSFGDTSRGFNQWSLDEEASQPLFRQAVELGINFWDTANVYQLGSSEEFVGRAIKKHSRRENVVLSTKVSGRMHDGPGGQGLSRAAIMEQVDASLTRLGTDYIDLYLIHRFDPATPVEETMEALHDVVKAGKARYLGASSMFAWQFVKLQRAAELNRWTRFVAMQDQYNLIKREEEREMLPLCLDTGVGAIPYSPQGKGRLTRPWANRRPGPTRTPWPRPSTWTSTRRWSMRCSRSPRREGSRWLRWPWRGCCPNRWSRLRSSEPRSPTTSRMRSRRWTSR